MVLTGADRFHGEYPLLPLASLGIGRNVVYKSTRPGLLRVDLRKRDSGLRAAG